MQYRGAAYGRLELFKQSSFCFFHVSLLSRRGCEKALIARSIEIRVKFRWFQRYAEQLDWWVRESMVLHSHNGVQSQAHSRHCCLDERRLRDFMQAETAQITDMCER